MHYKIKIFVFLFHNNLSLKIINLMDLSRNNFINCFNFNFELF